MDRVSPADAYSGATALSLVGRDDEHGRALFDNANQPLCLLRLGPSGPVVEAANRAMCASTGYAARDVIGRAPADLLPARAARRLSAAIRRCVGPAGACLLQCGVDLPAGHLLWSLSLAPLWREETGAPSHVLLAGETLPASEAESAPANDSGLLERLAFLSPGLVFVLDAPAASFTLIRRPGNPAQPASDPAMSIDILHPGDLAKLAKKVESLGRLPDGTVMSWMFRVDCRDGRGYRTYLSRNIVLGRDDAGAAAEVIGVAMDITRHVGAAQEVRALSDRLLDLQNEERRRIARELHDSTAQHLAALGLIAARLRPVCADRPEVAATLGDMEDIIAEAQREIRVLTYLLHPPQLETEGLSASLNDFVAGYSRRSEMPVALSLAEGIDAIPLRPARAIFRIVQEGLNNVHRHASATKAVVQLALDDERVVVTVSDDGCGFDPDLNGQAGMGLAGMRARAHLFGGNLDIMSGPEGTMLRATLRRGEDAAA